MTFAINRLTGGNPSPFVRPAGIENHTICTISGTQPSRWCPSQREEVFASDQPPLTPEHDLWREVSLDTWTNFTASPECEGYTEELMTVNVSDESARKWILQDEKGREWARDMGFEDVYFSPQRECAASDPRPHLEFVGLKNGQVVVSTPLDIHIIAYATANFKSWRLEGSAGDPPGIWSVLIPESRTQVHDPTSVGALDLGNLPAGPIHMRLIMESDNGGYADMNIRLILNVPTPTRIPTFTPSATPLPPPTETPTNTPFPSDTSWPSETPTF
jgi:hypothetical protein